MILPLQNLRIKHGTGAVNPGNKGIKMFSFKSYITEEAKVKVGDEVEVHYKKMNGDSVSRGNHKVTKVGASHFEIDREGEDGKPMKFKHNGYGKDYGKSASGRVKGLSRSSGHYIKSLTEETE